MPEPTHITLDHSEYPEGNRLRVLIATNMYPTADRPYLGVFVAEQERSLRALGVEVVVEAHVAGGDRLNYLRGLASLRRRLRAERFDVIHSHHTYSTLLALAARRLAGVRTPLVETFHESEIFQRGTPFGQDALRRLKYSRGLKAWALRRVDFAIPVQRDMLRIVLGEDEAARVPSAVIPAGIDVERFAAIDRSAARAALGWQPGETIVLYPCDPAKPEKRADLARGGFDRFAKANPQTPARLIVGGGIPYARMPEYLAGCDAVLVPTDYEASPTVVKEALACGRPVISTDVGDVREAYGDLPGVFLCDWTAESVATQLASALAIGYTAGGRARLLERGLSLEAVAARLKQIYDQLSNP